MQQAIDLEREADALLQKNDAAGARRKLVQALALDATPSARWLKLASVDQAIGNPSAALEAIGRALAIDPLDFMALMSRAHILDRTGSPDAGEAYERALAGLPEGDVPHALHKVVERAKLQAVAHVDARDANLQMALRAVESGAGPEERARLARMRTNMVRKTRPYHSEPTHSHFPGLSEREFHDRADFPWLNKLEAATDSIAAEFAGLVSAERAELVPYIQYPDDIPVRQWKALNRSRDWTAIHLLRNGIPVETNSRHCPRTLAVLREIPQPVISGCSPNAMFSLLAPGTHIPPHTGVANTRLVCHLPLVIPDGCWFRVGATRRAWRRGEAFVFDDTIEHEAENPSQDLRVVLILDAWHPGLSSTERIGVRALLEAESGTIAGNL